MLTVSGLALEGACTAGAAQLTGSAGGGVDVGVVDLAFKVRRLAVFDE